MVFFQTCQYYLFTSYNVGKEQDVDLIKLFDKKYLLAGVTTVFIGLVFVGIAISFYTIQILDSSKMASLDYEIPKPIAINKPPPLNESVPIDKKEEIPQDKLISNSLQVQNPAKINGSKVKESQTQVVQLGTTSVSSTASITPKQKLVIINPSKTKANNASLPNQSVPKLPTNTAPNIILSSPNTQSEIVNTMNPKDNTVLIESTPNPPGIEKDFVQTDLFSSISSFSFKANVVPQKLFIPIVDLSADIKSLNITTLNESLSWETPNRIVGYIPITSTPGELNQGWYFGHYETLLTNEGNVFNNLPEIVDLIKNNNKVFVMINAGDYQFLYQTYKTEIVHQDALELTNSKIAEITLVTCVPKYKYDHRLLVTASLIGVRPL